MNQYNLRKIIHLILYLYDIKCVKIIELNLKKCINFGFIFDNSSYFILNRYFNLNAKNV